jgi:hypothetical protein
MRRRESIGRLQQAASGLAGMSAQQRRAIEVISRKLLTKIRGALNNKERKLEEALPDRIAAALTTALALVVVIGWALRKRS